MKGYKAFEKGLICNGKQYAENTVFEEETAEVCRSGIHFCENPFDVLDHYPLVNDNGEFPDFAEVEALDKPLTDGGKKFCSKKLKIGAKLSFGEFIKAAVNFNLEKTRQISDNFSSGDFAQIGSSGDFAQIGSSGNSAQIGSSGDYAKIASEGKNAIICCAGHGSMAKGKIGSWITLAEWKWKNDKYIPTCVKTKKIDGVKIKEDTFYTLKNGKFVEVKNAV